jgi:hypothetical protein
VFGCIVASARCRFRIRPGSLLPRPPLPFRTITSFRIKAFCRLAASQPAFRTRPISVRSPPPSELSLELPGVGSMFPVRYVFGGLLFLKPLGTFINMIPKSVSVNAFCEDSRSISTTNIRFDFRVLDPQ